MNVEGLICCLIFVTFMFGLHLFDHLKKLSFNHNMYMKIGWIAEKEHPFMSYSHTDVSLRSNELFYYIMQEQIKMDISEDFQINYLNENEKKELEKILNLYKDDVVKSYFHGFLTKSKNIFKLTPLEYFMYSLFNYLNKQLDMNETTLKDKIYDYKNRVDSYSYYTLTEFGRVCYKVNLITRIFVENNHNTKKLFEYIDPKFKNHIIEYLEKNEVCFWSYRP